MVYLLHKIWSFWSNNEEMGHLWKIYFLSILEQSCFGWGSCLTSENENNLERMQKTFFKLVLEDDFSTYNKELSVLGLQTLMKEDTKLLWLFHK